MLTAAMRTLLAILGLAVLTACSDFTSPKVNPLARFDGTWILRRENGVLLPYVSYFFAVDSGSAVFNGSDSGIVYTPNATGLPTRFRGTVIVSWYRGLQRVDAWFGYFVVPDSSTGNAASVIWHPALPYSGELSADVVIVHDTLFVSHHPIGGASESTYVSSFARR